jgi:GT2 family glycosyltransferase/glycosyltransferase involved in cell wall biosynthesis/tetratricopeptide (TPR) repeat protein
MRRSPASIVILAWNAWETTQACLDSLSPTLGVRDQVIVVDNGSTDATPRRLGRYPWIEVVTNEDNHGFAGGCNDGAARARHDVLVFLNNDTILCGRWLDPLIVPFDEDATVGATGPRSNFVSGPQLAEGASYLRGDMPAMRRFARTWAQEHRAQATQAERLVGFCLAVRRDVFDEVGGFDTAYGIGGYEDDDLCRRIVASGQRLLIAHESFVHHEGHQTFDANGLDWFAEQETNRDRFESRFGLGRSSHDVVKVSACLITKDEETNIATCLASLDGFVDEIVIYDTGSTDATVEVARAMGATVIEGYWDDDFSRARNAALEHCTGDWIAWLDADETLVCDDVDALLRLLDHVDPQLDGFSVPIDNLTGVGVGSGFVHSACRLFRRARCEWTGRLHEQIAGRGDHRGIQQVALGGARIRHTGYLDEAMRSRNKTERNLRVAQAEVAQADGWERGFSLTSLGRAFLTAGRFEEAFEHCRAGLEHTDNLITRRLATRTAGEALLHLGRYDEALAWIDDLRAISTSTVQADIAEGKVRLVRGEFQGALDLFDRVGVRQFDDDGFEVGRYMFAVQRAEALEGLGRTSDAADVLLEVLVDQGVIDVHLAILVDSLRRAGRPLDELAAAIPAVNAPNFLAQVLQLPDGIADELLDACLRQMADGQVVLATAATLARRLPIDRALLWSARMREAGFAANCPLVAIATGTASPELRARAAATAVAAFGDPRGRQAFMAVFSGAQPSQRHSIRAEANALCPDLLVEAERAAGPDEAPVSIELADPRVSIVIPCFNKAELTLGCLQSLQTATDPSLFEVILVDNGSDDATVNLGRAEGPRLRFVRNEQNTGFGPACNQGAALARGEYVLVLNNDTVLLPGWLEPLVAALDEDPGLAAVQPKLLYPDGRLNDAGGLVFGGGEPWIYGKGSAEPEAPQFSCRRAPDYASGACLLVRRTAFTDVGGFDARYAPAYYEDTDLSFSLRAAGWKVLYEPASKVIHLEGGTAGTDTGQGIKQYQVRNAEKFKAKWADELGCRTPLGAGAVESWAHRPQGGFGPGELRRLTTDGAVEAARADAAEAKSILVLDSFMPVFDRASGGLRTFTMLQSLRQAGHAVTFYALAGGSRNYAEAVGRLGIACFGGDRAESADRGPGYASAVWPTLETLLTGWHFDVVVVSPWSTAELVLDQVRRYAPRAALITDTNDVHFLRLQREAAVSERPSSDLDDAKRRELSVYRRSDRVVCVTDEDAAAVRHEIPDADIVIVPNAHAAVDGGPDFDQRTGCLFVGNFNHLPNGDAMAWWKQEIGPILAQVLPEAGLTIIGNDPMGVAAEFAGPGITVAGTVESTLPYLHRARVSVAPLRYGAGMKGKVGEALAAGVPVVLTTVAAEGMGLVHEEHVLIADTPDSFASAVQRLYLDGDLWHRLRHAGRAHALSHFGVDRMRTAVSDMLSGMPPTASVTARSALSASP